MESRRLSSRATPLYKYGSFGFILLWSLVLLSASGSGPDSPDLTEFHVFYVLVGIALIAGMYVLVGRAKKVELLDDALVVSSWNRSITVPIRDVEAVGGSHFSNPERMWLDLRRPSEFGSRVHFLPPQRWFSLFSPHPLVAELRATIEYGAAPGQAPIDRPLRRPLLQRIAIGIAVFCVFAAVLNVVLIESHKSSEPYKQAVAVVRTNPDARRYLGQRIEPGWFVAGSLQTSNDRGSAELEFPVSGAHSEGTVRLSASHEAGVWTFSVLELQADGRSIDLLNE